MLLLLLLVVGFFVCFVCFFYWWFCFCFVFEKEKHDKMLKQEASWRCFFFKLDTFYFPSGCSAKIKSHVWISMFPHPYWWCVLWKGTRMSVCWAFTFFPFTFTSIWCPGRGELRLQTSYVVRTWDKSIFHLKLPIFDFDTRHFIRLWIIFTKAGPCLVCLGQL